MADSFGQVGLWLFAAVVALIFALLAAAATHPEEESRPSQYRPYDRGDIFDKPGGRPHTGTRGTVISDEPAPDYPPGTRYVRIREKSGLVYTHRVGPNGQIDYYNVYDESGAG